LTQVKQGSENLGFCTEVFQDLINRGLTKVVVFVTDNFSGLNKIIRIEKSIDYKNEESNFIL
jgi:transposase-like protein